MKERTEGRTKMYRILGGRVYLPSYRWLIYDTETGKWEWKEEPVEEKGKKVVDLSCCCWHDGNLFAISWADYKIQKELSIPSATNTELVELVLRSALVAQGQYRIEEEVTIVKDGEEGEIEIFVPSSGYELVGYRQKTFRLRGLSVNITIMTNIYRDYDTEWDFLEVVKNVSEILSHKSFIFHDLIIYPTETVYHHHYYDEEDEE